MNRRNLVKSLSFFLIFSKKEKFNITNDIKHSNKSSFIEPVRHQVEVFEFPKVGFVILDNRDVLKYSF